MDELSPRDSAMTGLILGFFASSWFGWAQEQPPPSWRRLLIAGAVFSLAVAAVGGVYAWRNWSGDSALGEPGAMRRYLIILGVEFAVAALGSAVLAIRHHAGYLAPWICMVVGVHFWPLAPVLENPSLYLLGALLVAVAATAVVAHRRTAVALSAVTGLGAGVFLLSYAARGVLIATGWLS